MELENTIMQVRLIDGSLREAVLEYSRQEDNVFTIRLHSEDIGTVERSSTDYFSTLIEVRKELDIQGVTLLCWGSRIDVWPNSQQFQWAGGLVAHRHVMGEPTWITNEDGYEERVAGTRMIFDYEADGVVSVVDQRNYRVLLRQYSLNLSKLGIDKEVEALQMTLDDFERLINTIRTLKKDRPTIQKHRP